ncbi:MAG: hypothetical protein IKP88_21190 [Lachnospiraceae bacterium]|nr:hypothetical protein [Lachnospiraceae bacterium]
MKRKITITRKRNFIGYVVDMTIIIDHKPFNIIKSGEFIEFYVDEDHHFLEISVPRSSAQRGSLEIPPGTEDVSYIVSVKAGILKNQIVISQNKD